jgi:hypothetical protein
LQQQFDDTDGSEQSDRSSGQAGCQYDKLPGHHWQKFLGKIPAMALRDPIG